MPENQNPFVELQQSLASLVERVGRSEAAVVTASADPQVIAYTSVDLTGNTVSWIDPLLTRAVGADGALMTMHRGIHQRAMTLQIALIDVTET